MEIITFGNELLRQKSQRITTFNGELLTITQNMIEALHKGKGVGLAGAQVGFMKRIFVTHIEGDDIRVFINPSLLETSAETSVYEEGCLSLPGMWSKVTRSKSVHIQAWNEKAKPFNFTADGILARVILHELDHLEGILFIDHLTELKRKRLLTKIERHKNN
ncbi:MAG: peptide deformylase [Spirochaetaceae bacterium]|jgi:peptide deformylase|nr:peptide deformylase [Spirochaetaceae bacterium]